MHNLVGRLTLCCSSAPNVSDCKMAEGNFGRPAGVESGRMNILQLAAAALFSTAMQAGESPVAGKWSCTNVPVNGPEAPWTLVVRNEGSQLSGILTDGE